MIGERVSLSLDERDANAVLPGIEKCAASGGLPTNMTMRFWWAAEGAIGSSPMLFDFLSRAIVRPLYAPIIARGTSNCNLQTSKSTIKVARDA